MERLKLQMDYLYLRWRSVVGWLAAIALAVAIPLPGQEQRQNTSPDSSQKPKTVADAEAAANAVIQAEKIVSAAFGHLDNLDLIKQAIPAAEYALKTRLAYEGEGWWETIDAQQSLDDLRRFSGLSAEQRAKLAETVKLNQQAVELYGKGKYSEAVAVAIEGCEIHRQILGDEHNRYATSLNNLGELYRSIGRYDKAEPLFRQVLSIRKKTVGEEHPDYASGLNNLAVLYRSLGRYEEAEPLLRQAVKIDKKALGDEHSAYTELVNNLAALCHDMGRYEEAETLYSQVVKIEEKSLGEENPDYAGHLNNLGTLYDDMGRYEEAERLYRRALAIKKKVLQEEHPDYALGLNNLAVLYEEMGRYGEAEPLFRKVVDIMKKALGEEHLEYAVSLNNLATLYESMSRYDEAEPLMRQALEIQRKAFGEEHIYLTQSLNNLARLYQDRGRYDEAEPLLRQVIAIEKKALGPQHPLYALCLGNLAALYYAMGRYDEAEPLLRQAIAIKKNLLGEDHPDYTDSLTGLAMVLVATGREEEVSRLLLASAQGTWRHLTENFPRMSEAQKRQFLTKNGVVQNPMLLGLVFGGHGRMAETGLREELLGKQLLFEAARQESAAFGAAVASAPSEWRQSFEEMQQLRGQYATLVLRGLSEAGRRPELAGREPVDPGYLRSLHERIEELDQQLRQSNPAYASQARLKEVKLEDVRWALRPGEAMVEYVRYAPYDASTIRRGKPHYGAFVLLGNTGDVIAVGLGEADQIDDAVRRFGKDINEFIAQWKKNTTKTPSDRELREQRREYRKSPGVLSETRTAVDSSALRALIWDPLEKHLGGVNRVYVAPDGPLSLIPFEALAREDGSARWRYLAEERELIYVGTGRDLGRLSLSAAGDKGGNESGSKTAMLIGNPAFHILPEQVAQEVAKLPPSVQPTINADVQNTSGGEVSSTLGDNTGGTSSRPQIPHNLQQLPMLTEFVTNTEKQLTGLGWTVSKLVGPRATEEAVKQVHAPTILQFATHGYLWEQTATEASGWDNPLLHSMLMLAGANHWQANQSVFYRVGRKLLKEREARRWGLSDEQMKESRVQIDDGILTAYEVTGMNLQGTELVNLTACQTGLGEVTPDGVAGLRQSFLLAGARSLTMSLWEIPAREATQQMADFYQLWLGGGARTKAPSRYKAFRAAQLAALKRARIREGKGHPFYWAGMVYTGDPGDLPLVTNTTNENASSALLADDHAGAKAYAEEAIQLWNENADAYLVRAFNWPDADQRHIETDLSEAIRRFRANDDGSPGSKKSLAFALASRASFNVRWNRPHFPESFSKVEMESKLRDLQLAISDAQEAMELDSGQPLALAADVIARAYRISIYRALDQQPTTAAAHKSAELFVKRFPSLSFAHFAMGWILDLEGQTEEAIGEISQQIRLDPTAGDAFLLRAGMYARLKRCGEAKADLAKADGLKATTESEAAAISRQCP